MAINESRLRQIIREEAVRALSEKSLFQKVKGVFGGGGSEDEDIIEALESAGIDPEKTVNIVMPVSEREVMRWSKLAMQMMGPEAKGIARVSQLMYHDVNQMFGGRSSLGALDKFSHRGWSAIRITGPALGVVRAALAVDEDYDDHMGGLEGIVEKIAKQSMEYEWDEDRKQWVPFKSKGPRPEPSLGDEPDAKDLRSEPRFGGEPRSKDLRSEPGFGGSPDSKGARPEPRFRR